LYFRTLIFRWKRSCSWPWVLALKLNKSCTHTSFNCRCLIWHLRSDQSQDDRRWWYFNIPNMWTFCDVLWIHRNSHQHLQCVGPLREGYFSLSNDSYCVSNAAREKTSEWSARVCPKQEERNQPERRVHFLTIEVLRHSEDHWAQTTYACSTAAITYSTLKLGTDKILQISSNELARRES